MSDSPTEFVLDSPPACIVRSIAFVSLACLAGAVTANTCWRPTPQHARGRVVWSNDAVFAPETGRIRDLRVENLQRVESGQVICDLEVVDETTLQILSSGLVAKNSSQPVAAPEQKLASLKQRISAREDELEVVRMRALEDVQTRIVAITAKLQVLRAERKAERSDMVRTSLGRRKPDKPQRVKLANAGLQQVSPPDPLPLSLVLDGIDEDSLPGLRIDLREELTALKARRLRLLESVASDRELIRLRAEAARWEAVVQRKLRRREELAEVTTPISGDLSEWRVQAGDLVRAGDILGSVRRRNSMRIELRLSESQQNRWLPGQPVMVQFPKNQYRMGLVEEIVQASPIGHAKSPDNDRTVGWRIRVRPAHHVNWPALKDSEVVQVTPLSAPDDAAVHSPVW